MAITGSVRWVLSAMQYHLIGFSASDATCGPEQEPVSSVRQIKETRETNGTKEDADSEDNLPIFAH